MAYGLKVSSCHPLRQGLTHCISTAEHHHGLVDQGSIGRQRASNQKIAKELHLPTRSTPLGELSRPRIDPDQVNQKWNFSE